MTPKTRAEAARLAYGNGIKAMQDYHGCSQCVLLALQDTLGRRNDDVFKAATGLSGGVGGMGNACGALLGACLMLGIERGRAREEIGDEEKDDEARILVGRLYKWFETQFGSANCRDIRTRFGGGAFYDFDIPWQHELAEQAGVFEKCGELVAKTAAKTAELLWDAAEPAEK